MLRLASTTLIALSLACLSAADMPRPHKPMEGGGVEVPQERSGYEKGEVLSVNENSFTIRSVKGYNRTYTPHWRGGMPKDGGGPDKEMVAAIRTLVPGETIELKWEWEERYRVIALRRPGERTIKAGGEAPHANKQHEQPKEQHPLASCIDACQPEQTSGKTAGTVISVDPKGRLVLKTECGPVTYVPRWISDQSPQGGGFDPAAVASIAKLQVGQKVTVAWEWDERPRVVSLMP